MTEEGRKEGSKIPDLKMSTYKWPCNSNAFPCWPPMSQIIIDWSKLPEKSSLFSGSHAKHLTLPTETNRKVCSQVLLKRFVMLKCPAIHSNQQSVAVHCINSLIRSKNMGEDQLKFETLKKATQEHILSTYLPT